MSTEKSPYEYPKDMKMPFGKHKGVLMDQVPASYLDWLMGQEWIGKFPQVVGYIKDHKASIHNELVEAGALNEDYF